MIEDAALHPQTLKTAGYPAAFKDSSCKRLPSSRHWHDSGKSLARDCGARDTTCISSHGWGSHFPNHTMIIRLFSRTRHFGAFTPEGLQPVFTYLSPCQPHWFPGCDMFCVWGNAKLRPTQTKSAKPYLGRKSVMFCASMLRFPALVAHLHPNLFFREGHIALTAALTIPFGTQNRAGPPGCVCALVTTQAAAPSLVHTLMTRRSLCSMTVPSESAWQTWALTPTTLR